MEVIIIKIPIQSTKKDVKIFLNELMTILNSQNFNEDNDLIIIKSTKDDIQFSTGYLMLDLDYDTSDIVERLIWVIRHLMMKWRLLINIIIVTR